MKIKEELYEDLYEVMSILNSNIHGTTFDYLCLSDIFGIYSSPICWNKYLTSIYLVNDKTVHFLFLCKFCSCVRNTKFASFLYGSLSNINYEMTYTF